MATSDRYDQELQPMSNTFVAIKSNAAMQSGSVDRDRADLIRLGKKPVLKVGFEIPLDIIRKLMDSICSAILGSCRCWVSVAPFSLPGKHA